MPLVRGGIPRYNLEVHRFNAADFGIPQVRRRVLFVGTREDLEVEFAPPPQTNRAPIAGVDGQDIPRWMRNAVSENASDLESLPTWLTARDAIDDIWNPAGTEHSPVPDQNKRTCATIIFGNRKRRDRQLNANLPSPTIRAQHHGHIEVHYGEQSDGTLRRLTIRECARLQGFPDSFEFPTSATQAYIQIGNAMPPVAVHRWAKAIARWLRLSEKQSKVEEKTAPVVSERRNAHITSNIMKAVKSKGSKAERALG